MDFADAPGVDVVLTDPYSIPLEDGLADAVVTSSCFEHSEFFWLTFMEALRLLTPSGLLYMNAPANGVFHRHPVDCWRFYPDSGVALQNWARRNGVNAELLESFVGAQGPDRWNDFTAVFVKDSSEAGCYPDRMIDRIDSYTNGRVKGEPDFRRFDTAPEDTWAKTALQMLVNRTFKRA